MFRPGLLATALVGVASAVAGGLAVGPAKQLAADWAEGEIRERWRPRLERKLQGDVRLGPIDRSSPGRFTVERVSVVRDDGTLASFDKVHGAWSLWAGLWSGPARSILWAEFEGTNVTVPADATPVGRRVRLTDATVRLEAAGQSWRVAGSGDIRLADEPPLAVDVAGDTEGGIEVALGRGMAIRAPGRLGLLGVHGVVDKLRLGLSPARAVVTELRIEGLPDGVQADIGSVAIDRHRAADGARSTELSVRGLVLSVDLDTARPALRRLMREPAAGAARGADASDVANGGAPAASLGAWAGAAEGAEVIVRSGAREDRVAPVRLALDSGGTIEAGFAPAQGPFTGALGARLIPVRADGGGLSVAFDAWVDDGAVSHPKISAAPLTGIDGRALGLAKWQPSRDRIEVDLREATLGQARLSARFVGRRLHDRKRAKVRMTVDLPDQPCQALIDALPSGTLSVLDGMQVEGRFRGGLEVAVDMSDLEESIVLEGRGDPANCVVTSDGDAVELADLNGKKFVHRWPRGDGAKDLKVGPGTRGYVRLGKLPRHVVRSMIVTEDGRFWGHNGVNLSLIRKALKINLTKRRFAYGGSTITQQLMKNLFLTRRKTLARKVEEALLALAVERVVPKRRLMELYVNVIEFGPDIYGISKGARFYFSKSPTRLKPIEGAFLATIKPKPVAGPKLARRGRFKGWWHHRLIEVMGWLEEGGYISPLERARAFPYYPQFRGPVLSSRHRKAAKAAKGKTAQGPIEHPAFPARLASAAAVPPRR